MGFEDESRRPLLGDWQGRHNETFTLWISTVISLSPKWRMIPIQPSFNELSPPIFMSLAISLWNRTEWVKLIIHVVILKTRVYTLYWKRQSFVSDQGFGHSASPGLGSVWFFGLFPVWPDLVIFVTRFFTNPSRPGDKITKSGHSAFFVVDTGAHDFIENQSQRFLHAEIPIELGNSDYLLIILIFCPSQNGWPIDKLFTWNSYYEPYPRAKGFCHCWSR